jgi:hypothetical protein
VRPAYGFKWSLVEASSGQILRNSSNSVFRISKKSLKPGSSYNATLILSAYQNFKVASSYAYSYIFTTGLDSFVVSAGNGKEIGNSQELRLAPLISNEYYRMDDFNQYNVSLECYQDPETRCRNQEGVAINLTSFLAPGSSKSFIFPPETFSSGSYEFFFTATNKRTGVVGTTLPTRINVVTGTVPDVTLEQFSDRPSSFDNKFKIRAYVSTSSISNHMYLDFLWTSETECDGNPFAELSLTDSNLRTSKSSSVLKFQPGVMVPGAKYCFSCHVHDTKRNVSSSSYVVTSVKQRPSNGVCVADNSVNGTVTLRSLIDTFSFSCSLWVTDEDSYPLYYSFSIRKRGSPTWITITRNTPESSLNMDLLEGEYTVRAFISDQSGTQASSPVDVQVVVTGFALRKRGDNAYYDFINEWLANKSIAFNETRNIDDFTLALGTISTISFDSISSRSHKSLQLQAIRSIQSVIFSGLLSFEEDSVGFLGNQIRRFTGSNCFVPAENIDSSLDVTYSLLEMANSTTFELGSSLQSDTLDQILGNLDTLLCSTGQSLTENLLSKINPILQKISSIALRRAGCGEVAYETEMSGLSLKVGKEESTEYLTSSDRTLGHFNLQIPNDNFVDCPSYVTGGKNSSGVHRSDYAHIDGKIYQMSYVSESGIPQKLSGDVEVRFTANLTDMSLLRSNNPRCSYLKFENDQEDLSSAVISQEGCVAVSVNTITGQVACKCNHLSDFLIAYVPVESEPTPTPAPEPALPTQTETPNSSDNSTTVIAAAVGGSIGAILVVGAALYVGLKVMPKRSKYSPGEENDSKSAQVMIGIPGPSNEQERFSSTEKVYPPDVKNADFS